jgi:Fic family protein
VAVSPTARPAGPLPFSRSPHLVEMIAETERLAAVVDRAAGDVRTAVAAAVADQATEATLALDGSRVDTVSSGSDPRPGTWLDAMGTVADDATDEQVLALEAAGVHAAWSPDLDDRLLVDPLDTLAALHGRLTRGLVTEDVAGRPRRTGQAVHDARVGRILYFPSDPAVIPRELALLGAWLSTVGAREHGLVTSGIVHLEVLRIHPFEAANGRLARAAARAVLRARGLDPDGLAAPEPVLADDPLGYQEEVARTMRRRDATIWLERWGEAVTEGLRRSARRLEVLDPAVPARAQAFLTGHDEPTFTVADYRGTATADPEDARADLRALLDAGEARRVPGSRGLRYLRAERSS